MPFVQVTGYRRIYLATIGYSKLTVVTEELSVFPVIGAQLW